jgi:hypothetical protein
MQSEMTLIKYRDAGMNTYTYFWKNKDNHTISPFFNSEAEALQWNKPHDETDHREIPIVLEGNNH